MATPKDYSNWSLEELKSEEKKLKNQENTSAVLVGVMVGVMIYGVANGGFKLLYILIPILIISAFVKQSQKQKTSLKEIREFISAKDQS